MKEENKNWIDAMIERQSIPEEIRKERTLDFCKDWDISESTYYYQASKTENQKKIIETALNNAKKYAPEVLENLGARAKKDNKAAEMYLEFILELSKKMDVTTGGDKITPIFGGKSTNVQTDNSDKQNIQSDKEN